MTSTIPPELVDPTAASFRRRPAAPGLDPGRPATVVLVDGMLNKGSDWGRGILDAAELVLRAALPHVSCVRLDLDPLSLTPADRWADAVIAGCDALVVAAGDCITCTTRGVRNALEIEARGRPATIVCTAAVEDVVDAVRELHGAQHVHRVLLHDPLFGRARDEIARLVQPALTALPESLVRP